MYFPTWLRNLLHIETLFMLGVAVMMIYFLWKYRSPMKSIEKLNIMAGKMLKIPNNLIKKKSRNNLNKHEERCREIFQEIFQARFKSIRPNWLKNPATNRNLELDGFNPYIVTPIGKGLAFEYDGAQHARYVKRFHTNGPVDFLYQSKKDSWKDLQCKKHGIMLIRIPHFVHYTDLERYIRHRLQKVGMGKYLGTETEGYMR